MAVALKPILSTLPPAQKRLWDELGEVPTGFVLYGGTAIALQLGHRVSVDFDFFGSHRFDPDVVYGTVPFLGGASVVQKDENTLTALVDRGGPVRVSFFGVPGLSRVREPLVAPRTGLRVADLVDLAGMKAAVVQKRAEARDYIDLAALIERAGISLPTALAAASHIYGPSLNPQTTLKALSFFEDGNLQRIPQDVRNLLIDAVRAVDLDNLPTVDGIARSSEARSKS